MKLNETELVRVVGGASATMVNAVLRAFNTILDFGRTIGSAIRRLGSKNYC